MRAMLQARQITPELSDFARLLLKERMRRNAFFEADLFAEPAWNMMLDLFVALSEGKRLTVSDTTLASGAPHATATRWLQRMAASGLVSRTTDPRDGRRVFVELTAEATGAMIAYLETLDVRPGNIES